MKKLVLFVMALIVVSGCSTSKNGEKSATCVIDASGTKMEYIATQGEDNKLREMKMLLKVEYTEEMIEDAGGVDAIIMNTEDLGLFENEEGITSKASFDEKTSTSTLEVTVDLKKADSSMVESMTQGTKTVEDFVKAFEKAGGKCTTNN